MAVWNPSAGGVTAYVRAKLLRAGLPAVIALTLVAVPGPAIASTGGWLPPTTVFNGNAAAPAAVAQSVDGETFAAWMDNDRHVAIEEPGSSTFGPSVDLGDGQDEGVPYLASDAAGDALVAWWNPLAEGWDLQVDFRPAGGEFSSSTITTIPGSTDNILVGPALAFLPDGTAVVAWGTIGTTVRQGGISVSVRPPGPDSQFGPPTTYELPGSFEPMSPLQIAADGPDRVALLWSQQTQQLASGDEFDEDQELMLAQVNAAGSISAQAVPGSATQGPSLRAREPPIVSGSLAA